MAYPPTLIQHCHRSTVLRLCHPTFFYVMLLLGHFVSNVILCLNHRRQFLKKAYSCLVLVSSKPKDILARVCNELLCDLIGAEMFVYSPVYNLYMNSHKQMFTNTNLFFVLSSRPWRVCCEMGRLGSNYI